MYMYTILPRATPPTDMGQEKMWPWLTEFCPLMSMWQAEADTELTQSTVVAGKAVGQILLTMQNSVRIR